MTRLLVSVTKEVTMEAVEEIDIEDLWDYTLEELMDGVDYEEIDSDIISREVEVVET